MKMFAFKVERKLFHVDEICATKLQEGKGIFFHEFIHSFGSKCFLHGKYMMGIITGVKKCW